MKSRVTVSLAIGLALVAASCTSSDPILPTVGTLSLRGTPTPTYSGRFALARFQVAQVALAPEGTGTLPNGVSLLPNGVTMDITSTGQAVSSPIRLTPGLYRVVSLSVGSFALNTENVLPSGSSCSGGVLETMREADTNAYLIPGELLAEDGMTAPVVSIENGIDGAVQLGVDGPGLVELLEERYNCGGNFLDDISPEMLAPLFSVN